MKHPDKGGDHGEFTRVLRAYHCLSDVGRRLEYDSICHAFPEEERAGLPINEDVSFDEFTWVPGHRVIDEESSEEEEEPVRTVASTVGGGGGGVVGGVGTVGLGRTVGVRPVRLDEGITELFSSIFGEAARLAAEKAKRKEERKALYEEGQYELRCMCGDVYVLTKVHVSCRLDFAFCPCCSLCIRILYDKKPCDQS